MQEQKKIIPQYINAKAGMDQVNAQSIAKRVAEMTKGTPKDLHQKQMERKRTLEVASMLQKILKFKPEDKQEIKNKWRKRIMELRQSRPIHTYWGHFDFDMFYVACQLLEKPDLKNLPCAVGGDNSVLCTANYAARLFGVRAAMPTFIAKKLCPELIIFKPDFEKYRKFSEIFRERLKIFDLNIQSHGLDEAYIDLTQHLSGKSLTQQQQIVSKIREDIYQKTNLTVSCGIGPNKMLAKIASDINKPNGQFIVENNGQFIEEFMKNRKIRKIPGIGPVNQYYLKGLRIQTAHDILENTDTLSICFSENTCEFFISAALGLGSIQHQFKDRKSVGKSQTFRLCSDKEFLEEKVLSLCQQVSHELQQLGFLTLNVVLSYQLQNYERKDKTFNLDKYCKEKQQLFNGVISFFRKSILMPEKQIRLLGIKCTSLIKIEEWKRKSIQNYFVKLKQKQEGLNKGTEKKNQQVKEVKLQMEKDKEMEIENENERKMDTGKEEGMGEQKIRSGSKKKIQEQPFMAEIKEKSQFICPICNIQVKCMNNISAFNRHIDKCLKLTK